MGAVALEERRRRVLLGASLIALALLHQATPAEAQQARQTGRPLDGARLAREGFRPATLSARRRAVLGRMSPGALMLVAAAALPAEDYDPYRPNPDYLYLTGVFSGPGYVVLKRGAGDLQSLELGFLPTRSRSREVWEGPRPTVESVGATAHGYSELVPNAELAARLGALLKGCPRLYLSGIGRRELADLSVALPQGLELSRAQPLVAASRLVKDAGELALLQRAIDATCAGQVEAMRSTEPGQFEYELQATVEYLFKRYGSEYPAFNSICGSGPKSCVLHYNKNRRRMAAGDLVVVDIGASFRGYCADVTRTFPVSGRFTPRQKEIYQIVLAAQRAGIEAVRPGVTLGAVHRAAAAVIREAGYGRYFPHGTSHWLGLETHDTPYAARGVRLEPGMVLTVEPGIYIPEERLGVRIEDDVVVTSTGCRVLSNGVPRTVDAIEALMAQRGGLGLRAVAKIPVRGSPRQSKDARPRGREGRGRLY